MNRSKLREIIITVLYQTYIFDEKGVEYKLDDLIKEQLETENSFVSSSVKYIKENQKAINGLANKYMKDWNVERIGKVDKAILSLAIYELKETDTPEIVAINEAIELSKKYSDDKVVKMINAVLDNIMHNEIENE